MLYARLDLDVPASEKPGRYHFQHVLVRRLRAPMAHHINFVYRVRPG